MGYYTIVNHNLYLIDKPLVLTTETPYIVLRNMPLLLTSVR